MSCGEWDGFRRIVTEGEGKPSSPSDLSWPDGEQLNRGVVLAGFLAVLSVFLGFSRLFHS